MKDEDNRTRSTFLVDETTLEEAKGKLDHGELSEELRTTVQRIAHGAEVAEETRLTDHLETLREARRKKRQERDNIEQELEEINRDIERTERRLEQLREQDGEYDGVLSMLEEDLHDGRRILGGSDKIKRAASIGDCSVDDVVEDLRERNPNVPDKAFRPARDDEEPRWKTDTTGIRAAYDGGHE